MAALEAFMLAEYNMQEYDSMLRQMADADAANALAQEEEEEDLHATPAEQANSTVRTHRTRAAWMPDKPKAWEPDKDQQGGSFPHKTLSGLPANAFRLDKANDRTKRRASNIFESRRKSTRLENFNHYGIQRVYRVCWWLDQAVPIVSPNPPIRRFWDLLLLSFVLYNAVQVPFQLAFGWPRIPALLNLDLIINFMFAADILLTFRTSFLDHQGNLVRDSRKIAGNYLRFWFWVDLLATIPYDTIGTWLGASDSNITVLAFLKTPRLLRLGRVMRYLERQKNANSLRVLRLLALMCLIAHWLACVWYTLYDFTKNLDWMFSPLEHESTLTKYTSAFYFAFLLLIGENLVPLNNIERVYFVITVVLGAAFYASVVGNMALLVSNLNATKARHKHKKDMVQDTMRYLGIPVHLQERVQAYFDYITQYGHPGPEGMAFLGELPRCLHEDVSLWMHKDNLLQIPLFSECEHAFLMQLATRLKLAVFLAGETIFQEGDVGHEMYVIKKGTVAVVNHHGELIAMLHEGMSFGELGILSTARRTATCIACSPCDLGLLSMMDLQLLMKDFKESALTIRQKARDRLLELEARGTVVLSEQDGGASNDPAAAAAPAQQAPTGRAAPGPAPGHDQPAPATQPAAPQADGDQPEDSQQHADNPVQADSNAANSQLSEPTASNLVTAQTGGQSKLEAAMTGIVGLLDGLSEQVRSFESRVQNINVRVSAIETKPPVTPEKTSLPTVEAVAAKPEDRLKRLKSVVLPGAMETRINRSKSVGRDASTRSLGGPSRKASFVRANSRPDSASRTLSANNNSSFVKSG